jgi:hypothetical protein
MQLSRETQVRIGLMVVGGTLPAIALALWELVIGKVHSFPDFPYLFLRDLGISFPIGMFSVWFFWRRLNLCEENRSSQPNQSKIWVKKGIASATLTCFLIGFLLTIISVALQGTIEEDTLLLNLLVGGVMSGTVIGLSSLVIMGLPALLTGAAFGYCAERLTRRLVQPH